MTNDRTLTFKTFWWRITMTHMIAYLVIGAFMWFFLDVENNIDNYVMAKVQKPIDSPWIASATFFQIFTGFVWAIALWPFREIILEEKGWLKLWVLLIGLAIIGTEPPAVGAIEGFIYLDIPIQEHIRHMPEHFLQTLMCSFLFYMWYKKPKKLWNIIAIVFLVLVILMSAAVFLSTI